MEEDEEGQVLAGLERAAGQGTKRCVEMRVRGTGWVKRGGELSVMGLASMRAERVRPVRVARQGRGEGGAAAGGILRGKAPMNRALTGTR